MATQGTVTKIYELKTLGYDDVITKLNTLKNTFDAISKAKKDLNTIKTSIQDPAQIDAVNKKLLDQNVRMAELTKQIRDQQQALQALKTAQAQTSNGPKGPTTEVGEYAKLVAKYKEATAAARELALQQGKNSEQTIAATRTAQAYKEQLRQINDLVNKGGPKQISPASIRDAEVLKRAAADARQLAKDSIAAANTVEKLRTELSLATSRRNRLQIDSAEFKQAEKDVTGLNKRLTEIEQRSGDFRRNVGNYKSGFDGVRNSINQLSREAPAFANSIQTGFLALSNNIPMFFDEIGKARKEINALRAEGQQVPGLFQRIAGSIFSFGTILSIGVTLLTFYGKEIGEFIKSVFKGKEAVDAFSFRQKLLATELKNGGGFKEAITAVKELQINVDLARKGFIAKEEVVKQYNETVGETTGQVKTLDEVEQQLVRNGDAYIKMMLLKAAANAALEEAALKAVEAEKIRGQNENDFLNTGDKLLVFGAANANTSAPGFVPNLNNQQNAAALEAQRASERKKAAEDLVKKDVQTLEDIAKKFQEDAAKISKDFGFKSFLGNAGDKTKTGTGSKLDNADQEALKEIDAIRNQQLAAERTRQNEIARIRKATLDEEITYLENIRTINANALQASIAILERKKSLNNEEKQTLAKFREELSSIYLETSNKINEIEKRRFEQSERRIKADLDLQIKAAERKRDEIESNPTLSAQAQAEAQLAIDQEIFDAQVKALADLEAQSAQFNQEALERQREAVERSRQVIRQDQRAVTLAEVADIKTAGEIKLSEIRASYAITRKAILDNEKTTAEQKKLQIQKLEQAEKRTLLSAELDTLNKEVAAKKALFDQALIDEKTYLEAVAAQRAKAAEVSGASDGNTTPIAQRSRTIGELIQGGSTGAGGLRSIIGTTEGTTEDQLLGQVIATSYQVAQEAMEGYFAAEESAIRNNLRIQQERLKIEEEQALNRAQTQAEQESIRKQFDDKKRAEEKKAGEELKRIKIAEARIALATELANIAAAAASNPANGATFGASGAIMYGVLSALALGRYALNVSNINRTQFEQGGQVPAKGGKFGGKTHSEGGTPFEFKGQSFEAEVDELAIVRTKSAPKNRVYNLSGTQQQIASMLNQAGGGVAFAAGGTMRKFETGGTLGESLQPPVFTSSINNVFSNQQISKADLDQILSKYTDRVEALTTEQASRIDRLQVVQQTSTVSDAMKKQVLQTNIGTL